MSHTRAQQILGLLCLEPEIQEAVLHGDRFTEMGLRRVARIMPWEEQEAASR